MKLPIFLAACLIIAAASPLSSQNKSQTAEPVVWGALSNTSACVIFVEGHKTTGRFYGVAVTTKTIGKLTLLEAQNYTFNQKEVLETDENMANLMHLAQTDHVKFVKIPEKYPPELLEKARSTCKADAR